MDIIGKNAENAFKHLCNRYTRDKKRIEAVKKSGIGTQSLNDVKTDTSDLYTYLTWLDSYIQQRRSSTNLVLSVSEECSNVDEDEAGTDDRTEPSCDSDCSETASVIKSKTTGKAKNMKRPRKDNFEKAGIELIKTIGSRIDQKQKETDRDEGTIFSELIGTQLKKLPLPDRLMAKMEINQIMYKFMVKSASEYHYPNLEQPSVMTQSSQQQHPFRTQPYHQFQATNQPQETLRMTNTVIGSNTQTYPPGYFFEQLKNETT